MLWLNGSFSYDFGSCERSEWKFFDVWTFYVNSGIFMSKLVVNLDFWMCEHFMQACFPWSLYRLLPQISATRKALFWNIYEKVLTKNQKSNSRRWFLMKKVETSLVFIYCACILNLRVFGTVISKFVCKNTYSDLWATNHRLVYLSMIFQ